MKRICTFVLCCFVLLGLFGCGKTGKSEFCHINGTTFNFLSDKEMEKLREPLEKLILEALTLEPVTDDVYDYIKLFSEDSPTVIPGVQYGLLDVNFDGVPELVVEPYGYNGSSGAATYCVFDIYSGKNLGTVNSGQDDWCVYFDAGTNELVIMGEYITRGGWTDHSYYCVMIERDKASDGFSERYLLKSHHSYIGGAEETDVNDNWSSVYYVDGEKTGPEIYLHVSQALKTSYARIPETKLAFVRDEHFYDLDISGEEHARYIVDALLSTGQRFIKK